MKGSRTQSTTTELEMVNVMVAKAERKIEMDYAEIKVLYPIVSEYRMLKSTNKPYSAANHLRSNDYDERSTISP